MVDQGVVRDAPEPRPVAPADQRRPVPVRTIMATIGLVLATVVGLYLVVLLARIEAMLLVAAFFAVVLAQPVEFLHRRLRFRRGLATLVVILVGLGLFSAMVYSFISPLVDQTKHFADKFPGYLSEARAGRGPVGHLVKKYNLDKRLQDNQKKIRAQLGHIGGGALNAAKTVASGAAAVVTILVLAILMVMYGPQLMESGLGILSPPHRERVRAVGADCAKAVTGYVFGNLLISVIAGLVTFAGLAGFGVPFSGVLALWVGFADLIPLVGATLGAVPAVLVAFLHSTTAGIGMIVVYVIYQQFENHVLQVVIMSRTVQLNQLFVLVSVLIGVELLGFIGALLAIPAAGVVHVIVRDLWDHRSGRPKPEPTIGEDEVPVSEAERAAPPPGELEAASQEGEPTSRDGARAVPPESQEPGDRPPPGGEAAEVPVNEAG